jgi:TorA maturation chaperone TorD
MGRIGPYECSNTLVSAGGHTAPLADIAGFYRAFGVKIQGDRPDHMVAELEFFSLVTVAEAAARSTGADDQAEVAASAARSFLRDHLGRWLDAFATRVLEVDPPLVWGPIAAAAASMVRSETRRRNVIVVEDARSFLHDEDLPEEAGEPECGSDLDFIE